MGKLNLVCLLTLCILTLKGQNTDSASNRRLSNITTGSDTLIINPNPFDSVTVIQFTISNNDSIWLDVFNSIGGTIKSYYNGTVLSSGSYTLNFNGDTLPNGVYFVRLKINSNKTQTVKLIKSSNAVGLKENVFIGNVTIYPNPATSIVIIIDEQNQFKNATIEIKNNLGQIVYSTSFIPEINISELSTGIYFLTLQSEYNSHTFKIIKH